MKNAFEELEFYKVKELIKNYCNSSLGKKLVEQLGPLTDKAEIEQKLSELHNTVEFLNQKNSFDLTGLSDTEFLFPQLKSDEIFSIQEFLLFFRNIRIANSLKKNKAIKEQNFSYLFSIINDISIEAELERQFDRTFNKKGEINDNASDNLAKIRKKRVKLKKRIYSQLERILVQNQYENIIQDRIITIRDQRYVIPVKEGGSSILKGFVHSRSRTGASVFLEPLSVFELNNSLINLDDEERQEILIILKKLYSGLQKQTENLLQNLKILQKIDFLNAAARYCLKIGASVPKISFNTGIRLKNAKHPLLYSTFGESEIIPFSLELGRNFRSLVISGVNTGGKTVTLKAIGLLSIMALSGLMLPCEESEIGIFHDFFTDINDEQSIEDSISTFSSHIAKIKVILDKANEKSLVLIDELGTGTDPEEGSALAQAILERLVSQKAKVVITTHLNKLKLFATQHPLCENASMRFDQKSQTPTYQLDVGFPGNSYALDIARDYNLNIEVILRARKLIDQESLQLSYLLKKTEQQRMVLSQKINEYSRKNSIAEQTLKLLQQKENDWKKIEREKKLKTIQQGEEFLLNLQQEFEQELNQLKTKLKKEKKIIPKEAKKFTDKIAKKRARIEQEKDKLAEIKLIPFENPEIGNLVLIKSMNIIGKVIRADKSSIKVKAKAVVYSASKKDIFEVPENRKPKKEIEKLNVSTAVHTEADTDFAFELNVIGLSFDDAQPQIDKYIDKAILLNLRKVRILHGKGTGQLRKKIWNFLKRDTRISDYYSPPEPEGGSGVTVVAVK